MREIKFKIKKGRHYHSNWIARLKHIFTFRQVVHFYYFIPSECWYERTEHGTHINKLFGLCSSDGPHRESQRYGWRPGFEKGSFDIYRYIYIEGKRRFWYLKTVSANTWHEGWISAPKDGVSYYMWPYFGGVNKAPRDMEISLILHPPGRESDMPNSVYINRISFN